jgi:hypothetical protein
MKPITPSADSRPEMRPAKIFGISLSISVTKGRIVQRKANMTGYSLWIELGDRENGYEYWGQEPMKPWNELDIVLRNDSCLFGRGPPL